MPSRPDLTVRRTRATRTTYWAVVSAAIVSIATVTTTTPGRADGDYVMAWSSLGAGGVVGSAGGEYELSGTVGQPTTSGPIAFGEYELRAGFWVLPQSGTSSLPSPGSAIPDRFELSSPSPNPFHATTSFAIDVPRTELLSLRIFSVDGREVRRLFDMPAAAGQVRASWNGTDETGTPVPVGVYFARATLGSEERTTRIVRLTR